MAGFESSASWPFPKAILCVRQSLTDGTAKTSEFGSNGGSTCSRPQSQFNGDGGPPSRANEDPTVGACPSAASPCALARDTDSCNNKSPFFGTLGGDSERCPENKLPFPALQKEEWIDAAVGPIGWQMGGGVGWGGMTRFWPAKDRMGKFSPSTHWLECKCNQVLEWNY